MTVIVPSRSLVTKASGPEGFEVQLASVKANKRMLPQRRNDTKPAGLPVEFFVSSVAPLRRCVSIFMSGTAPPSTASTLQHHTTASGAADPKDPTGPNVSYNLPSA